MLMPPLHRRHKYTHASPLHPLLGVIFAFRPQKRIARSRQHDDVRAGAMAMSLFIFAGRKFRDMRAHGIVDKFEESRAVVTATLLVILRLETPQIGDKVRLPHSTSFHFGNIAPPLAPFIGAAAVAIGENESVSEDVIQITVAVDDHRRIGQRDHSHRRVSLRIEMLMPRVEWRREETSFLPLERVLLAALVPDRRRALPR